LNAAKRAFLYWPFCGQKDLIFKGFDLGVGIIPKLRDGESEWLGGCTLELLSLKVYTNPGIAKRPILLVLFFKGKNGSVFKNY